MKHLLTAFACFFALSMNAQIEYPFNPDFDGNELKKDPFNNKAFRILMLQKSKKTPPSEVGIPK